MNKLQKLYTLLNENNLELSLADFIEYTYNEWSNDYLTIGKAVGHIADSRRTILQDVTDHEIEQCLSLIIKIGRSLNEAR